MSMNFIIYCLAIISYILIVSAITFCVFKFAFWVFDVLDIENPIVTAFYTIKDVVSVLVDSIKKNLRL